MKVKAMKADQANAELDESTLFLTAIGGPKHGRVVGFGSVIAPIKTANNRDRQNHTSSVSGLTNCGAQEIFTRSEMNAMMEERDRQIAEERAQMKRDQAQNLLMFAQLYKTIGIQQLPLPVCISRLVGNMGSFKTSGSFYNMEIMAHIRLHFW